jgi:hypothetical protein
MKASLVPLDCEISSAWSRDYAKDYERRDQNAFLTPLISLGRVMGLTPYTVCLKSKSIIVSNPLQVKH